jgi:hypothetical protein
MLGETGAQKRNINGTRADNERGLLFRMDKYEGWKQDDDSKIAGL